MAIRYERERKSLSENVPKRVVMLLGFFSCFFFGGDYGTEKGVATGEIEKKVASLTHRKKKTIWAANKLSPPLISHSITAGVFSFFNRSIVEQIRDTAATAASVPVRIYSAVPRSKSSRISLVCLS